MVPRSKSQGTNILVIPGSVLEFKLSENKYIKNCVFHKYNENMQINPSYL